MPAELPALVRRAVANAGRLGFPLTREEAGGRGPSACLPDVGRFLALLAAGCPGGRIAELGTGAGIGAAWLASSMPPDCRLVTVEIDVRLAAAAAELFAADSRVRVVHGDGRTALAGEPAYDLVFADSGSYDYPALPDLLAPGGRLVMDDVTPTALLAVDSPLLLADPKRELFADPRLVSAEVVLPDLANALLVGTRRVEAQPVRATT